MKLTNKNYFSDKANRYYMSVSQYKNFMTCEAMAMAKIFDGYKEVNNISLLQGSYIHAWNEGTIEKFKEENPECFSSKGPTKGELKSTFKQCNNVIEAIKKDPLLMKILEGKKEVIFTAKLFDIPWKICIDSYDKKNRRFTDLKCLQPRSLNPGEIRKRDNKTGTYNSPFTFFYYYTQVSIYAEIERLYHKRDSYFEPFLACITKEDIPAKEIINFNHEEKPLDVFISEQLNMVSNNIERIKAVKNFEIPAVSCDICDYCRNSRMLTESVSYLDYEINGGF